MTRKPKQGDRLDIEAAVWADLISMRADWKRNKTQGISLQQNQGTGLIKRGFNRSGSDLSIGAVVGISDVAAFDTTFRDDQKKETLFLFRTPNDDDVVYNNFGILLDPAKDDAFCRVATGGGCFAKVDIHKASHKFAIVISGSTVLDSSDSGPLKILKAETGTGVLGCVVEFTAAQMKRIFPVSLVKTGGFDGSATAAASWVYNVYEFGGTDILFGSANPVATPHKWRRPNLGKMTQADFGLACYNNSSQLVLAWINEVSVYSTC